MSIYRETADFAGRSLSIETGKLAKQASGSVYVSYGDSRVLVAVTVSESPISDEPMDFVPLTVDYLEKTYAAGKIPGGFFKREGRPLTHEILTSRLIDRPVRPLLPKGFPYEVQIVATVLSSDGINDTDVMALCGASAALMISEVPFEFPIAGVRVGYIDGEYVANPTEEQLEKSEIDILVAASKDSIVMVEGEAKEVSEDIMLGALLFAHKQVQPLIEIQEKLASKAAKPKIEFVPPELPEDMQQKVRSLAEAKLAEALTVKDKLERHKAVKAVKESVMEELSEEELEEHGKLISFFLHELESEIMRKRILDDGVRIDGRSFNEVRPITCEVGLLPRVHGSALFTRGETQALVSATLGTKQDIQIIDALYGDTEKKFMLHYNFPPFSVGEAKRLRSPSRREIGHGNLAERALKPLIPDDEATFPYVIRVVSEILESNGSSSMATVCGGSLALMDAGVPIREHVAGIAMGLIKQDDKVAILTDIIGDEDHLGDMDFKVTGTRKGITAMQMDIKIKGLSEDIMKRALDQAHEARMHILGIMEETIKEPRKEMSPYAPRIITIQIPPDKIRDVIGSGGKTIRGIISETGVSIDIEENGDVFIASKDIASANAAIEIIRKLTEDPEVGKVYKGIVRRITDFGAIVEILPGTQGLLHISQIATHRIRRVEDVLKEGDEVEVLCTEVDDRTGKIRLSRKALLEDNGSDDGGNGGNNGGNRSRGRNSRSRRNDK